MEDWQKRIIDEKAALDIKANALSKYIESIEDFDPTVHFDQELLNEQFYLMMEYSNILNMRILRF
jgi:hypothetical protein